ncbi:phasin family protein [Micromonospora sp. NPDC003816]|uniref:phasin family protein n=1 Tax=Micromonospora sp. NPDC003816 TaxID=3364224 RepID=UPI0036891429
MQDAWRAYLELAMGLTEAPRKKAQDAVRRLAGSTGATAAQLQTLAEELRSTGAENREALTKLVRFEVERALGAVGLATADEVEELERRVRELERWLRAAADTTAVPSPVSGGPEVGTPADLAAEAAETAAAAPPTGHAAAKNPVAKKAVAKKAVAKKAGAVPPPEDQPAAKKAVAKVAKKAVAKKTPGSVARPADGDAPARPASRPDTTP